MDAGEHSFGLERPSSVKISVVLPVLNEADTLPLALEPLHGLNDLEVIVVDGGSQDASVASARRFTSQVVSEAPGRAWQMNAGARKATGEVLLFLHADSRVDAKGLSTLRAAMLSPEVVGGAFRLKLDSPRLGIRAISAGANFRARWLGLPFGDQGLFVRADVFQRIGGFPEIPLMEDVAFVRKLRREGKVVLLHDRVVSSPRRWERDGVWSTTLRNWGLLTLYFVGISPQRLARFYRAVR